jgi:hypothetical protein
MDQQVFHIVLKLSSMYLVFEIDKILRRKEAKKDNDKGDS